MRQRRLRRDASRLGGGVISLPALVVSVATALQAASGQPACTGARTAPALDHVVLVVRDLDAAAAGFARHGFRLKQGRLHPNNLLNRHIKFRDGTSIELMTVAGEPRDAMAREYAELLAAGEGGVYAAFTVSDIAGPEQAARSLQLASTRSGSGGWRFLSFPASSPAAAVFFGAGTFTVQDPDSLVAHEPDVAGLDELWLEGSPQLGALLERLGARRCGDARAAGGLRGERWALSRGSVVIVPARSSAARPRVLGVVLRLRSPGGTTVQPHEAFWIRYHYDAP